MGLREYLEYASEGLVATSLVLYVSTRMMYAPGFTLVDLAYLLALFAFLWSRGYAEYLEHEVEKKWKQQ